MMKFYGIYQLVEVKAKDVTKSGQTVVYFIAASKRGEDKTDFFFCKMFGKNADFFLRNLAKNEEGKYKSRKMFLEGTVETFKAKREVVCLAKVNKDSINKQTGVLYNDITIKATNEIQELQYSLLVKNIEFLDKKSDIKVEVLSDEYNANDNINEQDSKMTKEEIEEIENDRKSIAKELGKYMDDNQFDTPYSFAQDV